MLGRILDSLLMNRRYSVIVISRVDLEKRHTFELMNYI